MSVINNHYLPSHVILKYETVITDNKLYSQSNKGRKIFVNEIIEDVECHLNSAEWIPDNNGKVPIVEVGYGGVEISTFTEKAKQIKHKHKLGTEIYTVLKGEMYIKIDDKTVLLCENDEIIIMPGTIHEVISQGSFVTRVHSINCYGSKDKYIEINGEWISLDKS